MGVSHPTVEVHCDEKDCQCVETIELTSIARNGFDLRNLEDEIESRGWKVDSYRYICDCHSEDN